MPAGIRSGKIGRAKSAAPDKSSTKAKPSTEKRGKSAVSAKEDTKSTKATAKAKQPKKEQTKEPPKKSKRGAATEANDRKKQEVKVAN